MNARRKSFLVTAIAALLLIPAVALAAPEKKPKKSYKPKITRKWTGYGFLPGYPPAELAQRGRILVDRSRRPYNYYGPYQEYVVRGPYVYQGRTVYGYGGPGFYQNRYNGGSIGPCYTQTPIGPVWNCGR
jgi:hypothetical protein